MSLGPPPFRSPVSGIRNSSTRSPISRLRFESPASPAAALRPVSGLPVFLSLALIAYIEFDEGRDLVAERAWEKI